MQKRTTLAALALFAPAGSLRLFDLTCVTFRCGALALNPIVDSGRGVHVARVWTAGSFDSVTTAQVGRSAALATGVAPPLPPQDTFLTGCPCAQGAAPSVVPVAANETLYLSGGIQTVANSSGVQVLGTSGRNPVKIVFRQVRARARAAQPC
jgi:hypothetical protein